MKNKVQKNSRMKVDPIVERDCWDIIHSLDLRPFKNKKVLITGASGLLGQYLVQTIYLANHSQNLGCRLACLSLHGPSRSIKKLLPDKLITFKKVDLTKNFKLTGRYDFIFHAAGYGQPHKFINDPYSPIAINVFATYQLLNLARKNNAKFIYFSSGEVYGEAPKEMIPVAETYNGNYSTANLRAMYGEAKRLGEAICFIFKRDFNVPIKILRIFHVYGPGISINDPRVMGDFMRQALANKPIILKDDGKAIKTFCYITDAIKMILYVATRAKGDLYNVGGKDSISIKNLAGIVARYCGVRVIIPKSQSRLRHANRDALVVKPDLKKILGEIKKFSFTTFNQGIMNTIEWNKQEFKIK